MPFGGNGARGLLPRGGAVCGDHRVPRASLGDDGIQQVQDRGADGGLRLRRGQPVGLEATALS